MVEIKGELVWFITGTSSGLGRELVLAAHERGDCVIATARSLEKIQDLPKSDKIRLMQLDVTEGFASLKTKLETAAAFFGRIDVVVNNAGGGMPCILEEGGSDTVRKMFDLNLFGLIDVTNAALPHLRARRSGTVVHIGSRSSWNSEVPGAGLYTSSKAAVRVLAETMNIELSQFGIRTLIVEPSAFRTNLFDGVSLVRPTQIADYDPLAAAIRKRFETMPPMPGDPAKAMRLLVEVVRGEGRAKGKNWPLYLPLGGLAEDAIKEKTKKILGVLDEWGDIIRDLDLDK